MLPRKRRGKSKKKMRVKPIIGKWIVMKRGGGGQKNVLMKCPKDERAKPGGIAMNMIEKSGFTLPFLTIIFHYILRSNWMT